MENSIPITESYNHHDVLGSARIDERGQELLATGDYIIVPAFTKDNNGNRLVELAIIREDLLFKEKDRD